MIGFTDIVLQELAGPLNDEQKRQLAIVQESSRLLLGLINEMLDLSRIEAGRLQLALAPFDLAELLRKRVDAFAPLTAEKSLALECEIDPHLGAHDERSAARCPDRDQPALERDQVHAARRASRCVRNSWRRGHDRNPGHGARGSRRKTWRCCSSRSCRWARPSARIAKARGSDS